MADGVLVETISKQAFEDMQRLITQLTEQIKLTQTLSQEFKDMKLPSQTAKAAKATSKALTETDAAVKKVAASELKLKKAREAQVNKESSIRVGLANQKAREAKADETAMNRAIAAKKKQIRELEKEQGATARAAAQNARLSGAYMKQQARLTLLRKTYRDLAIRKELNGKLSKREEFQLKRTHRELLRKERALRRVDAQMKITNRNVGNYKSALGGLGGTLSMLVGGFGIFTALRVGQEIFSVTKELDALDKALHKVTDSQAEFTDSQFFLSGLADQAGVDILDLTKSYVKFLASAKETNLTLDDTRKVFANTALAGASLGLSADDVRGSMRALEQMLSKGNIQAEEIRGQLGERLPGAFQILAKSMGLTTKELNKQLELGNVIAADVLPKFADELAITFDIGTEKIQTMVAEQSRLGNAWTTFISNITEDQGALDTMFRGALAGATALLTALDTIISTADGFWDGVANFAKAATGGPVAAANMLIEKQVKLTKEAAAASEELRSSLAFRQQQDQAGWENLFPDPEKIKDIPKAVRAVIDGSIEAYKLQIKALKDTQNQTSKTSDEFEAFQVDIDSLQVTVDLLTGKLEDLNGEFEKLQDISLQDVFDNEDGALDFGVIGDFGFISEADLALSEFGEDYDAEKIKQAAKDLENLRIALEAIELVADGLVSSRTLDAIWDGFQDGALSAAEAMAAFGSLAIDIIHQIEQANQEALAQRLGDLKLEQETALRLVGDNKGAQEEINARFAKKEKEIKTESLKDSKQAAIVAANINAGIAITKVFAELPFPYSLIVAGVVTGLMVAQIVKIQNQKVPAFEQGTRNAPEGTALVNERRNEVIVSPGGEVSRPQGRNQLVHLEKGSHVYRSEQEFDRELGGLLGGAGINSFGVGSQTSPNITVKGNSLTRDDISGAMKDALKGRATNNITIDKNGIGTYSVSQMNKTNRLNNRVTFKGRSV